MKYVKGYVSQSNIDKGIQGSTDKCMIAYSLRDQGFSHIYINDGIIRANRDGFRHFFNPTAEMKVKLSKFDENKKTVKPFSWKLIVAATAPVMHALNSLRSFNNGSKNKRKRSPNKYKVCNKTRFTSGSYNKKLKDALINK